MINRLSKWITRNPKKVMLVALLLMIPSAIGFIFTPVNYDVFSYLPEDLDSVQGINILDEEFGEASMSIIVMQNMAWSDMKELEESISALENVKTVLWFGAVSESPIPISMLPESVSSMLYNESGDSTLMMVQFKTSVSSNDTLDTIGQIKKLTNKQCLMSGTVAMTYDIGEMVNSETPKLAFVAVVLALIALAITMESFALPLVLLSALGMSVLYNMGTNFMFGKISFLTQAVAAILQLGVTMDYSIFLVDRYTEEKPKYKNRETAMAKAITSTFASLAGSSMTTVFGFLALCFMSFTLGLDIGLVMAKGVLLGILTVVMVLPAMILLCEGVINKTRHKSLVPSFGGLNKITLKLRGVMSIIFVLLLVPSWFGQNNVKKYYNMMQAVPETIESIAAISTLKDEFNMASTYFVIINDTLTDTKEVQLLKDIQNIEGISSVMGLKSVVGTAFSEDIIPDSVKSMLYSGGKKAIMVNSVYSPATDECNEQVDALVSLLKSYDSGAKLTGEAPMYKDMVEVTDRDFIVTSIISMVAVFIVIALIFKSISVPFILVLSIELAIWINISISFLTGEEICFITPTVISCVQLGATVDYAILLTTRFREELQKGTEKKQAMKIAADLAHKSIFQSALIFFAATIGVYLVCDIDIVSSMCAMLARGSIISAAVIMLFLTPLLVVCESFINKTTYRWREVKYPTELAVKPPVTETKQPEIQPKIPANTENTVRPRVAAVPKKKNGDEK